MTCTGQSFEIDILNKRILYHYQSNKAWTQPYLYQNQGNETLSSSGCGIFSLCHAVEWMSGQRVTPGEMAVFSVTHGGRGDDGTDRPALLHALKETGKAAQLGFYVREEALMNHADTLFSHLYEKRGTAFCNLRPGHIVTCLDARIIDGRKELLVIDSVAESMRDSVRDHVSEVLPQSLTRRLQVNAQGLSVGYSEQYAVFYVDAMLPRDYNLLYTA